MAQHVLLTGQLGVLETYDPNGPCSLSEWLERFHGFCDNNSILPEPTTVDGLFLQQSNRRRGLFIAAMGPRAYSVVHKACLPDTPKEFGIPDLFDLMKQNFEPAGLVEANRFVFNQRIQQSNESVFEFVNALQDLAVSCDWGQFYDSAMKSRLIVGIKHADTRSKLLSLPTGGTFAAAKTLALQDDAQRQQLRALAQAHAQSQGRVNFVQNNGKSNDKEGAKQSNKPSKPSQPPNPSNVNNKGGSGPSPSQGKKKKFGPCHRCGRKHDVNKCPAINWECFKCKTLGHISKLCPKSAAQVNQVSSGTGTVDDFVDTLLDFE